MANALTSLEISRYKRHLLLHDVGGQGQQKLKAARVLVIGAGGLGSPVLMYLAAAGVGTIGIVDHDQVSLDNLQRQIIHRTEDIGVDKVASAARTIGALNPHVIVETRAERITADNAISLISGYDVVVDGSDNFATRYLVNDACYLARRPLVFAALGPFEGYVSTFMAHTTGADGEPRPNYRCLFPEAPPAGTIASCAEAGILGAVAGVVGTLQAVEVLKLITETGQPLVGRLLIYDAKSASFDTLNYSWDPANPLNGKQPTIHDLAIHRKPARTKEALAAAG